MSSEKATESVAGRAHNTETSSIATSAYGRALSFNRKDGLLLCGLTIAAIASTLPFSFAAHGNLPQAGDLIIHWPRMLMFDETLRSGVWYPRWLGGMNYGYGAATTMYYAPLVYYALSGAHAILGDWPASVGAVAVLAAIGSAITFYFYAKSFLSRGSSAVAALMYLLLPYHLIDLYHRGALAELIAFVWMPLVILMIGEWVRRPRGWKIVTGAASFALLLLTHPPVAYAFSVSVAVFVAAITFISRDWRPVMAGGMIAALGGALSAFYWLPAIFEVRYVNQSITDLFDKNKGYVTDLLAGSTFEKLIAATIIVTGLVFLNLAWLARIDSSPASKDSRVKQHSGAWISVGLVSVFMMLPLANPIVRLMPGISGMAFMWRWLAVTGFAASVVAGIVVENYFNSTRPGEQAARLVAAFEHSLRLGWPSAMAAFLTATALIFGIVISARASNLRLRFVAPVDPVEQDFTPAGAPGINELPRDISVEMMSGLPQNQARLAQWNPQERAIETFCQTADTLHVYSFMFPGWKAFVDGAAAPIRTENNLKTMFIDVPEGNHTVKLIFANTRMRASAQALTLAAAAGCAIILFFFRLIAFTKQIISV